MSQQLPSARRYRPHDFQSVVGQESTLRALMNALDTQRLHHAYLFTGTRGVGKTTLARILAKCLNCEQGISSKPCEQCASCCAIREGRFVDLIEVDAASKTKVEDTRDLLDNVQYLPTRGRFKIYLIDEVHMLSGHSFNALLKTLEEPPAHVKFILATTDPQKLPVTILSRCLQFHLRIIPFGQIVSHLEWILNKENAQFEIGALHLLSRAADGSLRDAVSLLDQALSYGQGKISVESVRMMLGLSRPVELRSLLRSILQSDSALALQIISRLKENNADFSQVLTELQTLLHQMAIAKEAPLALDESIMEKEALIELATEFSTDILQLYYQIALMAQRDLPYAPSPQMGIEMMVLRMIAFCPMEFATPIHATMRTAEQHNTETEVSQSVVAKAIPKFKKNNDNPSPTPAVQSNLDNVESVDWNKLMRTLPLTGMVKMMAEHCTIESSSSDTLTLILSESQKPLLNKRNEERLQAVLNQHFMRPIRLTVRLGQNKSETPAIQHQKLQDEKLIAAQKTINANPQVQKLIQTFEGSIETISIIGE